MRAAPSAYIEGRVQVVPHPVYRGLTLTAQPSNSGAQRNPTLASLTKMAEMVSSPMQILTNVAGGASAGTYLFAMTCPDMKTWGAKFAEVSADPEFQAIQAAVAEAPNGDLIASAIWQEV